MVDKWEGQAHKWEITPLDLIKEQPNSMLFTLLRSYGALLSEELKDQAPNQ